MQMHKKFIALIILIALSASCISSHSAAGTSQTTPVSATAIKVFKVEFFEPDGTHVLYSNSVPFSNIDPTKTFALADARLPGDNKSDIGLYCLSTEATTWYLKIGITGGNLPDNKLKYYLSQPTMWDGSQSLITDGTINPAPPVWFPIPRGSSKTIYTSGSIDTVNIPFGTLATLNFQIDPSGLNSGTTYTAIVTYTLTTAA